MAPGECGGDELPPGPAPVGLEWLKICRDLEEHRSVALGVRELLAVPLGTDIDLYAPGPEREARVAGVFMVHLSRHLDKFQFSAV